jgi:hypothetical protein
MDQIKLELADLLRPQLIGRLVEVAAELVDVERVGIDGRGCQVPQLHVFGHAVDVRVESSLVRRHGNLSCFSGEIKETGKCLSRRPSIGVDHVTRVRYSIMVRIRPSRQLYSAENEKKRPSQGVWRGTHRRPASSGQS